MTAAPAMTATATIERDWASLPPLLLCSIAERLTPVAYAHLRAVCSSWAAAVLPEDWEEGQRQPYYLPRSLHCPWLMVPSSDDGPTGSLTFLSLPKSLRPYRFAAPELLDKRIVGSHAGWLAAVDPECNVSLINPLTRAHIPLPSITTVPCPSVQAIRHPSTGSLEFILRSLYNIEKHTPERFCDMYFRKMILSSDPSSSPHDYIVALIIYRGEFLAFARAGDTEWSILERSPPGGYKDAVFVGQKLYTLDYFGEVKSFNLSETGSGSEPQPVVVAERIWPCGYKDTRYLLFSSGDLLLVTRIIEYDPILIHKTVSFEVEKIEPSVQGQKRLVPIKDLGCRSLFLGTNQSLSISTQGITGVRHNCIYFKDDNLDWFCLLKGKLRARDIGVFDLKEQSCQPLYPHGAWLTWPPPIWFAPVLN